jgi:hypothetical protein
MSGVGTHTVVHINRRCKCLVTKCLVRAIQARIARRHCKPRRLTGLSRCLGKCQALEHMKVSTSTRDTNDLSLNVWCGPFRQELRGGTVYRSIASIMMQKLKNMKQLETRCLEFQRMSCHQMSGAGHSSKNCAAEGHLHNDQNSRT